MANITTRSQIGISGLPMVEIFAFNDKGELVLWNPDDGEVKTVERPHCRPIPRYNEIDGRR